MGLYGPDGALQRYTRAGKRLHEAVNKLRGPNDAEVKAVAGALAATEGGPEYFLRAARAAITALDKARNND